MSKIGIGIIGVGYVGGAVLHWFRKNPERFDVFLYDKFKNLGSPEEVNRADVIFVATPTPFDENAGGYNDSAVRGALENIHGEKTVVIKSSVIPGSTERFQKEHPRKILLFNPEFLTAKNAVEDFLNAKRQIVGYTDEAHKGKAAEILDILPQAPYAGVMRATEAEMVKFFGNTYLATRVVFANHIYDLCEKLGIDYDAVKEGVGNDPRIGMSHLTVLHGEHRGYGGPCFPKDMKAFIQFADSLGINLALHKKADELNEKLRQIKINGDTPTQKAKHS